MAEQSGKETQEVHQEVRGQDKVVELGQENAKGKARQVIISPPLNVKRQNKSRTCDKCDKTLSSYRSLWRHKKKCPKLLVPYSSTLNGSRFQANVDQGNEETQEV